MNTVYNYRLRGECVHCGNLVELIVMDVRMIGMKSYETKHVIEAVRIRVVCNHCKRHFTIDTRLYT